MDKTMEYFINRLGDAEAQLKCLRRAMRVHVKRSQKTKMILTLFAVYIWKNELNRRRQAKINQELKQELESLKQSKGA